MGVEPPGTDGVLLAMPCAVAEPQALGAKIVSVFRGNAARGLPTVTSIYVLSDYATGAPLAIMDGGYLTAIRTAAGSAVATRQLARPDARTLGVFGTGVQARFHVETIRRVRALDRVLVSGTSPDKARAFADWVHRDDRSARPRPPRPRRRRRPTSSPRARPARRRWSLAEHVATGAHVNAVGAFTPTTRELPAALMRSGAGLSSTRARARCAEAGDLLLAVQDGRSPWRTSPARSAK